MTKRSPESKVLGLKLNLNYMFKVHVGVLDTCEPAGFSQQERAPGHEEKQSCLQQGEVPQLGELGHVIKSKSQGVKQKLANPHLHAHL